MSQLKQVQEQFKSSLTILDGGMGHQLKRMGVAIEGEVGSLKRFLGVALANLHDPELVVRAHQLYIEAGADVITTNSYACIPACLELATETSEGIDLDAIIRAAGECAVKARGNMGVQIAGCIPPLTATYRPDLVLPDRELDRQYERICEAIGPYSDLFLCETMSCVREACAAAKACARYNNLDRSPRKSRQRRRIWVAFTLSDAADGRLRSGEPVEDAVSALLALSDHAGDRCRDHDGEDAGGVEIEAVLFNCCSSMAVQVAIRAVRSTPHPRLEAAGLLLGGYANAFEAAQGEGQYDHALTPARYAEAVEKWDLASGLGGVVGGCCGVFPEHIALLRDIHHANAPPGLSASHSDSRCRLGPGAHCSDASVSGSPLEQRQQLASNRLFESRKAESESLSSLDLNADGDRQPWTPGCHTSFAGSKCLCQCVH